MGSNVLKDGDVISGAVLAALGVYVLTQSLGWDYVGPDGPGPGFFPFWYGVAIVGLSLLVVFHAVRAKRVQEPRPDWRAVGRAMVTWAAFAASIVLMNWLGFLLSYGLLTVFVVVVIFRRTLLTGGLTALGSALGFYLIFSFGLDVQLPVGPFGF
jgi:putative tricarboxylic transport membrane protein